MTGSISPLKYGYRTDFDAYSISTADVPVNSDVGSMYAKCFRRFDRTPNVMS